MNYKEGTTYLPTDPAPTLYRIFDKSKGAYWTSPRGKHVWNEAGHAKNAWNCACCWGGRGRFDEQPELVLRKFRLVMVDEG